MSWPYRFIFTLTPEETAHRRYLLDSYGQLAQLSLLFPLVCLQLLFAFHFIFGRVLSFLKRNDNKAPAEQEKLSLSSRATLEPLIKAARRLDWFLDDEIWPGWGTWKQASFGILWGIWLLMLVIRDTGDDYMHLTKRFGIVAVSQLPFHYLLSAKPKYNPIQYLTKLSHEELNPYHRIFGYVLIILFACHATLYLNFFIQMSVLAKRAKDIDVQLGLAAVASFTIIGTSAISFIRHYSYRIFYTLHIFLSFAILPILFFHVSHLRLYILETAAVYFFLVLQRYFTNQYPAGAIVSILPNTSLIKIWFLSSKGSKHHTLRSYHPGQHIYLSRPSTTPPSFQQVSHMNPFSVASLPVSDSRIEIIARELNGSTKIIADAVRQSEKLLMFYIEGPYGSVTNFPDLLSYDHILLVAGGVGATFTMPIYRELVRRLGEGAGGELAKSSAWAGEEWEGIRQRPKVSEAGKRTINDGSAEDTRKRSASLADKLHFVWSVRSMEDSQWGIDAVRKQCGRLPPGFELFVSGTDRASTNISENEGDQLVIQRRRPNLKEIVRDVFLNGSPERVAVLICGPSGLGQDLRAEVGNYVWKGREVFWHEEKFGW